MRAQGPYPPCGQVHCDGVQLGAAHDHQYDRNAREDIEGDVAVVDGDQYSLVKGMITQVAAVRFERCTAGG